MRDQFHAGDRPPHVLSDSLKLFANNAAGLNDETEEGGGGKRSLLPLNWKEAARDQAASELE